LLVIGDRVDKDIEVARRVGASAIRVRAGEFAAVPTGDGVPEVTSFAEAAALAQLGSHGAVRGHRSHTTASPFVS
jgi:ribonucleotide monophosphatase NagD (HAD superfamily)